MDEGVASDCTEGKERKEARVKGAEQKVMKGEWGGTESRRQLADRHARRPRDATDRMRSEQIERPQDRSDGSGD